MNAPGLSTHEFINLPLSARIFTAAAPFLGYRYAFKDSDVGYPYEAGRLPKARVGHSTSVNCSTMTTAILMAIYPTSAWQDQDYADIVVYAESLKKHPKGDSPIYAIERHGRGDRVPKFQINYWHLVQTWNRKTPEGHALAKHGGHAQLVFYDGTDCWTLEASSKDGVGPKFSAKPMGYFRMKALLHLAVLRP